MHDAHLVRIDRCHVDLIAGIAKSLKPQNILELGFGTGDTSFALTQAIEFNGVGDLTIVDNWSLFDGRPPEHLTLRHPNVSVHTSDERAFVVNAGTDKYDLVISDADHWNAHEWLNEYLRICRDGGIVVMHDTASHYYPRLRDMIRICKERGLSYMEFNKSSRPDEECWRGTLIVRVQK